MKRLLLVRHAQSENNASNERIRQAYAGDHERMLIESERAREADPALSELGRQQAELLADHLAPLLREGAGALVTSPMRRALETTAPLIARAGLARAAVRCEALLHEVGGCYYIDAAQPTSSATQIEERYQVRCSWSGPRWYERERKESDAEARARVQSVVAWAEDELRRSEAETLVIVAHGDLMTRWLRRWLGVPWTSSMAFVHANTGITSLRWHEHEGLLLERLNECTHLPAELRSGESLDWFRYVRPDFELLRFEGWSAVPEPLAAKILHMREALMQREGKSAADYADSDATAVHFVILGEGQLAAYAQWDGASGRLRQMVVEPRWRGAELGRRLVAAIAQEARRAGCTQLRVHAWLESSAFYRRCGFIEVDELVHDDPVPWRAMTMGL